MLFENKKNLKFRYATGTVHNLEQDLDLHSVTYKAGLGLCGSKTLPSLQEQQINSVYPRKKCFTHFLTITIRFLCKKCVLSL
jgi:hypothetical protein